MKKRVLSLIVGLLATSLFAASETINGIETVNGITWDYQVSSGEAQIYGRYVGYSHIIPAIPSSTSGSITIPSTLGGYPVTSIGSLAFSGCSSLTSVTIPEGVTSIGDEAFYGCTGLTSVTIPDGLTSIGDSAFRGCSGLTSVTIPSGVTSIGGWAFYNCSSLTSVTIPEGVTSIGGWAFYNCSSLTSVTIPEGVNSIGNYAFLGCSGLTSVTIPSSVTSIEKSAFSFCTGLTSVTIPSSVTSIGDSAFSVCFGLTSVTIPSSVTSIGDSAFYGCSRLTSVTIPSSVTEIGSSAFYGCRGLTSVTIPEGVTSIGAEAFANCTGLTEVKLPKSLKRLGDGAFSGCTSIPTSGTGEQYESSDKQVLISGSYASNVTIPNTVRFIHSDAFVNRTNLTSVTIPSSVTSIGSSAFSGCTGLTSVTIPSSVASIPDYAFQNCSSLTSVTILEGVTSIGSSAFEGCSGLTSVTIPDSVTSIGSFAFSGCKSLTSVTIPDSVTSIGSSAFSGCESLTSVHISDLEAWCKIKLGSGTSNPLYYAKKLYLNGNLVDELCIPSSVTSIGGYTFVGCLSLTSVTIPEGVTSIGNYVFYGCTGLTSVTISSSVTTIRDCAFYGCTGLTSVTIPEGVTSIGVGAFYGCSRLTSVTIPSSVTAIWDYAFYYCSSLTSVTIPSNVTSIGHYAFSGCTGLTSMTIPDSVTSIGSFAFSGCESLTSVTIPEGVTQISWAMFDGCKKLTMVTIPSSVTSIGNYAFRDCSSLTSVTIPDSVIAIEEDAFAVCDRLDSIYFGGMPPSTGFGVFDDLTAMGYYPQQYASAWQKVIDENGMWCGLQMEPYLLDSEGEDAPIYPTYRVPLPYPAATFAASAVGEEQVTLKVAAAKGYVFAGWHKDSAFTEACDSTLVDYRNPTYTYNVDAENVNFNAHFVTVEEDTKLDLVETKAIQPKGKDQRAIQLVIDSYSLPKVSVKGLPAGMKFTAKPVMVKGSKTEVEYPANTIYGTPTKPGIYTVTVSLTNSSVKKAVTKTFTIEVPNLTAADKYFRCEIRNDEDDSYKVVTGVSDLSDLPSLRLKNSNNKLAVSGLPAGLKYDAKTGQIIGVPTKAGAYTVTLTVTEGKIKSISTITIEVEALPEWVQGTFEGYSYEYGWYHDYFYQRYPDDPDYERIGRFTMTVSNTGKATIKTITASWSLALTAQLVEKIDEDTYYFVGESKKRGDKGRIAFMIERSEYDGTPRGMITDFMFDATESGNEMPYFIEAEAWENVWSNTSVSLPTIKKTQMFTQYYDETEGEIFGDLTLEFKANSNTVTSSFIFDVEIEDYDGGTLYSPSDNKTMKKCTAQIVITDYDAEQGLYSAIVPLYMKHLDDGEWIDLDFLVPLTIDESGDVEIDWDNVLHAHDDWADYYW